MLGIIGLGLIATAQAEPKEYEFERKATNLYVTVYKDNSTLLSSQAHNHAIRARKWTGSLQWDPTNASACNISFKIPVEEMEVDSPQARTLAASKEPDKKIKKGFEKHISEGDRKAVRKNMLSEGQLNSTQHKYITFQSTSCSDSSITGDFSLRGQTNSITMPARIKTADSGPWSLIIKGKFEIKGSDFGMKPYSGLGGAVANQDRLVINVYIRGK